MAHEYIIIGRYLSNRLRALDFREEIGHRGPARAHEYVPVEFELLAVRAVRIGERHS